MIKSKNPTGVYVVAPDGRLVTHPVHVDPGAEWPTSVTLKPGWRLATAGEVDEATKAAAKDDAAVKAAQAKRAAK